MFFFGNLNDHPKDWLIYSGGTDLVNSVLNDLNTQIVKGYLHYKTITSQNVSFEAQVKKFFIS